MKNCLTEVEICLKRKRGRDRERVPRGNNSHGRRSLASLWNTTVCLAKIFSQRFRSARYCCCCCYYSAGYNEFFNKSWQHRKQEIMPSSGGSSGGSSSSDCWEMKLWRALTTRCCFPTHTHIHSLSVCPSELAAAVWKAIFSLRFQKVQINGVTCHLHKRRPHLRSCSLLRCPPALQRIPLKSNNNADENNWKQQKEKRHATREERR